MKYFIVLFSLLIISSCSSQKDAPILDTPSVLHGSGIQVVGAIQESTISEQAGNGKQETYSISGVTK